MNKTISENEIILNNEYYHVGQQIIVDGDSVYAGLSGQIENFLCDETIRKNVVFVKVSLDLPEKSAALAGIEFKCRKLTGIYLQPGMLRNI